jgi:hypothetical protein
MVAIIKAADGKSDPVLTRLAAEDKVPWYKKPNLRRMYLWLFLCCMGVEMTSGFDSQLINTLQFSQPFNHCAISPVLNATRVGELNESRLRRRTQG